MYENELNELQKIYISKGYKVIENYHLHLQVSTFIEDEEYRILIIAPHSGNDYQWLMRADPLSYHDRWSVCMYNHTFNSFELLKKHCTRWFWNVTEDEWEGLEEYLEI